MALNNKQKELLNDLKAIHDHLRNETKQKYNRINPFYEDLFDWKERGRFWSKADKNITIYNSTTLVGDVEIGDNTWIGPFCSLDGSGGLKIGKFCSISAACQIFSHDTARYALTGGKHEYEYAPVSIGDYCFIGTNTIITKGATIGNRCLVASGAVVTTSFPDNKIIAGVPAKAIGEVIIVNDNVKLNFYKNNEHKK